MTCLVLPTLYVLSLLNQLSVAASTCVCCTTGGVVLALTQWLRYQHHCTTLLWAYPKGLLLISGQWKSRRELPIRSPSLLPRRRQHLDIDCPCLHRLRPRQSHRRRTKRSLGA